MYDFAGVALEIGVLFWSVVLLIIYLALPAGLSNLTHDLSYGASACGEQQRNSVDEGRSDRALSSPSGRGSFISRFTFSVSRTLAAPPGRSHCLARC